MLGVAAATAVLTGALLVGDSMRGSLRFLTLDRLGRIDELLVADRFFRQELAEEVRGTEAFEQHYSDAAPLIVFPNVSVEYTIDDQVRRASRLLVVGCDDSFWKLGNLPPIAIADDEIVLNAPLAKELGVSPADIDTEEGVRVTLRFPKLEQVPSENTLGKKDDLTRALPRLKVVAIIPAESLGRFSLHPAQTAPQNAYVSLGAIQDALDQEAKVNALAVAGKSADQPPSEEASQALQAQLSPTLEDYGFLVQHAVQTFDPPSDEEEPGAEETSQKVFDYYSFSSERMLIEEAADQAAEQAFAARHGQAVLTYLANAIGVAPDKGDSIPEDEGVPYSTITAIDWTPQFHPVDAAGQPLPELTDKQIVLNSWTADDLGAKVGDTIRVLYYEPETTHGETAEKHADFTLVAITPLTEPVKPFGRRRPPVFKEPPTLVNDPDLTPYVPGVTDTESIEDWDVPFPLTRQTRGEDDQYWNNHRTTPKAFISLSEGRRLWGSRFGDTTSYRIPAQGVAESQLKSDFLQQVRRDNASLGLAFLPIKRMQLEASAGATPFDGLFLALSFFIIGAALLLVMLLFRLGIEQRASELGLLLAVGLRRRAAGGLFLKEGAIVALAGGLLGVAIGFGYAALMVLGLTTWWVGAVATPFLEMHWSWMSLTIGLVSGAGVSMLTILWTIWRTRKLPERRLLSGQASAEPQVKKRRTSPWTLAAMGALALSALGLGAMAMQLGGEAQAGAFLGSGAATLTLGLLFAWTRLRGPVGAVPPFDSVQMHAPSFALAMRSLRRNPVRSLMTIALVAAASFLIIAVSSFHLEPTEQGVGGFDLMGQTISPVFANVNTPAGQEEVLGRDADLLQGGAMLPLRMQSGDDASCSNLYKAKAPRVLGVSPAFINYFNGDAPAFAWAGHAEANGADTNPWQVLSTDDATDNAVPVVLDKNTAMYSLQLYGGVGQEFTLTYPDYGPITFRVAGLLSNSILQGSLLINEEAFKRLFPEASGYRYFLIRSPEGSSEEVAAMLENRLSDQGFDASDTHAALESLLAVQNTYLSTFQALGSLGLLLGIFGLAATQLRSVLERRGELALLRAIGFRKALLGRMVLLENTTLLLEGLACGVFAAVVAVAPHVILAGGSAPYIQLILMLGVITVLGVAAGLFAVRATMKAPLLAALRGD